MEESRPTQPSVPSFDTRSSCFAHYSFACRPECKLHWDGRRCRQPPVCVHARRALVNAWEAMRGRSSPLHAGPCGVMYSRLRPPSLLGTTAMFIYLILPADRDVAGVNKPRTPAVEVRRTASRNIQPAKTFIVNKSESRRRRTVVLRCRRQ